MWVGKITAMKDSQLTVHEDGMTLRVSFSLLRRVVDSCSDKLSLEVLRVTLTLASLVERSPPRVGIKLVSASVLRDMT